MIGTLFFLVFMLLFMLKIMAQDFVLLTQQVKRQIHQCFGHDTQIYPDYERHPDSLQTALRRGKGQLRQDFPQGAVR